MSRFYVGNCMGTLTIVDEQGKKPTQYIGNAMAIAPHRAEYSLYDARAVVDMLNARERMQIS